MPMHATTTVRLFGALHDLRRERGLEPTIAVHIPPGGCAACELARGLDLPVEMIEAVFVNRLVRGLDHVIQPGDRVAFVPTGTPGPHRLLLGIYDAGRQERHSGPE